MGLMDKVKAQATQLAQKTQEGAQAGMAKFDAAQLARRSDPMLKSLGLAVLAERTGRGSGDTAAQIDQLITALTQHEAQNNVDLVAQAAQAQAPQAQMGGGQFMSSSQAPLDPTMQATMPGAAAGGPAGFPGAPPATGFPGAAPATGFPEPTSFPGAAPATGFPEPTSFPGAAPATGFPESTSFPGVSPAPEPAADDEAQPGFPGADGPTSFPPPASG